MGDVHQTVLQSIVTVTKAILVKIVKLAAMILVRLVGMLGEYFFL